MHDNKTKAAVIDMPGDGAAYPVHVGEHLLEDTGSILAAMYPKRQFGILTDTNARDHQFARLSASLDAAGIDYTVIELGPGESNRTMGVLELVLDKLLDGRLGPGDPILGFGGGVVMDMAGIASALAGHGVDLVLVPTTLAGQADVAFCGKPALNSPYGKNLIGFHRHPTAVFCDTTSLDTLPSRQLASGYAEILKYAVAADISFMEWLEANIGAILRGGPARTEAVLRAVRMRAELAADPERAVLPDFGRRMATALESATGFTGRLLSGEALAIGMVLVHELSVAAGHAGDGDTARLVAHLDRAGLPHRLADIPETPPAWMICKHLYFGRRSLPDHKASLLTDGLGRAKAMPFPERDVLERFIDGRIPANRSDAVSPLSVASGYGSMDAPEEGGDT